MLRPGSLPRGSIPGIGANGNTTLLRPARIARKRIFQHPSPQPHSPCEPPTLRNLFSCAARRREPQPDIEDMNLEQRLEHLDKISGRANEVSSIYTREMMMQQLGIMDPALYAQLGEEQEGEEEETPMEFIPWNDDPRTHVVNNSEVEVHPDGLRRRLVATADAEPGDPIIQVPLHNCLVLYVADSEKDEEDSIERQEATAEFEAMQLQFLESWIGRHGPLPPGLTSLLCDFSLSAPPADTKMALWLLWLWGHTSQEQEGEQRQGQGGSGGPGSSGKGEEEEGKEGQQQYAYWREALSALPQPADMPNLEFCSEDELQQLQWLPYSLPAAVRRGTLAAFYTRFCSSTLAALLGFMPAATAPGAGELVSEQGLEAGQGSQQQEFDPYAVIATAKAVEELAEAEYDAQQAEAAAVAARRLARVEAAQFGEMASMGSALAAEVEAAEAVSAAAAARTAAAQKAAEVAAGGKGGREAAVAAAAGLRPLPSFERFLWAYCHAAARSAGNGERLVFIPQVDPCLYTCDPQAPNTTLTVVADQEGGLADHFAVLVANSPLSPGEPLLAASPVQSRMPHSGGGSAASGSTTQLHCLTGLVPEPGGNLADLVDFEPETGTLEDLWYKTLMGQEEATSLAAVTDPYLRHLLDLIAAGVKVDANQLPPLQKLLPGFKLSKLWGPGLIAGVRHILTLEEADLVPIVEDEQELVEALYDDEALALEAAEARREATEPERLEMLRLTERVGVDLGYGSEGLPPLQPEVSYSEYEEWRRNPASTEIVEVPADPEMLETELGRAQWRRLLAAWNSLPRLSPDSRVHGSCMERALGGAPLQRCFPDPSSLLREVGSAESLLASLRAVSSALPTSLEQDVALLAEARAAEEEEEEEGSSGRRRSLADL
ncbi:hypothetical protein Agub_g9492, partial [Astrephomene gubernaculifera]